MSPTARNGRGRVLASVVLGLALGLGWGLARRVAARMGAPSARLESRLPEGAGDRLEEAVRHQALIRAERTLVMLRALEADAGGHR